LVRIAIGRVNTPKSLVPEKLPAGVRLVFYLRRGKVRFLERGLDMDRLKGEKKRALKREGREAPGGSFDGDGFLQVKTRVSPRRGRENVT